MTDRPIIFSAPMVRALLAGRKTQTRRVLKHQPQEPCTFAGFYSVPLTGAFQCRLQGETTLHTQRIPYATGDRLYVREAHAIVGNVDPGWVLYRASGYEAECRRHGFDAPPPESEVRWRPSIHMPRWASRLTLIVTDVRVQRLQEITLGDICSEGLAESIYDFKPVQRGFEAWVDLWNSLHGPDAWDQNPWVVAVLFDVQRGNIDSPPEPRKERTPRERGIFKGGV